MELKAELLRLLREKSLERGKIILSSGKESEFYIDARQTTLSAQGTYLTARIFWEIIKSSGVEAVGGMTIGADPIVVSISLLSYLEGMPIPAFIIRKEPKPYGRKLWIEGKVNLKEGNRVAIIEDVVTTGNTLLRAIHRAIEEGLKVVKVLCLVDREEGGKENLSKEGFNLEFIFTKSELLKDYKYS